MPNTPRLSWPYPALNSSSWYSAYEDQINAQDASAFAAREDRNLKITRGGTFSYTAGSGVLVWDEAIEIPDPITGFLVSIDAGSVTLTNGDFVYFTIPRRPLAAASASLTVSTTIPNTNDDTVLLCFRKDDRVYFREGRVLLDGDSEVVYAQGSGGPSLPALPPANLFIGDGSSAALAQPVTGDIGISSAGLTAIANGVVSDLKLATDAVTNIKILNSTIQGGKLDYSTTFDFSALGPANILVADPTAAQEPVPRLFFQNRSKRKERLVGYRSTSGLVPLLLTQDLTPINGTDLNFTGVVVNFVVVLWIAGGGLTHTAGVYLYNMTDGEQVTSSAVAGAGDLLPTVYRVPLTLGNGAGELQLTEKSYEVRLTNSSILGTETVHLGSAHLEIVP